MTWHTFLSWAAVVAAIVCLALALAAHARSGMRRPFRIRRDGPPTAVILRDAARKVGAIAILLMLASKCAGSN